MTVFARPGTGERVPNLLTRLDAKIVGHRARFEESHGEDMIGLSDVTSNVTLAVDRGDDIARFVGHFRQIKDVDFVTGSASFARITDTGRVASSSGRQGESRSVTTLTPVAVSHGRVFEALDDTHLVTLGRSHHVGRVRPAVGGSPILVTSHIPGSSARGWRRGSRGIDVEGAWTTTERFGVGRAGR